MPRSEQHTRRPTKDYAPRKLKSQLLSVLPLVLVFAVTLLAIMYIVFPKASRPACW